MSDASDARFASANCTENAFQLAGSASTNPVLFGLGVLLVLAWKIAGWWGLDRFLPPVLGTPWTPRQPTTTTTRTDAPDPVVQVTLAG